MIRKDVKNNLLDHSEAKVELLGKYLKRYLNIISNDKYTTCINYYDLFCGPGQYEDGGYGSPIVTLKQIKNSHGYNTNKGVTVPKINCLFNDIEKNKIKKLKTVVEQKNLWNDKIGSIAYRSIDYNSLVYNLAKRFEEFNTEKGFVFIDPYGYKEVKAKHIKALLGKNKKSEVLLWLPIQFMYRFKENGTPEALINFIKELELESEICNIKNVWEYISSLKNGFQNYLGENYFVDNFSLKKGENYVVCLYFFTSHIKGFEKMLEAKWEIDTEQGRGWEYSGNTPSLFFEQKTNELEEKLSIFLKEGTKYNSDIYEFTLRLGYLPKHANEILSSWQKKGSLLVLKQNGDNARKNSFYIKYYKPNDKDNKKVYFVKKL